MYSLRGFKGYSEALPRAPHKDFLKKVLMDPKNFYINGYALILPFI